MAPSCVHFYLRKVRRGHVGVHHIYSLCHRFPRHRCHRFGWSRSAFRLEPSKTREPAAEVDGELCAANDGNADVPRQVARRREIDGRTLFEPFI